MTPEEQLARVRAYYLAERRRPRLPVWPLVAAFAMVLFAFAAGLLFGWFLGSAA